MGAAAPARKAYKPGQKAPVSGVYRVRHARRHRVMHDVTIARGDIFPLCRTCGDDVTFRLVHDGSSPRAHTQ